MLHVTLTSPRHGTEVISEADNVLEAAKVVQILLRSFATEHGGCLGDSQCYFACPDSDEDGDNITVGEFAESYMEPALLTSGEFTYFMPDEDEWAESGHFVTVTTAA